MPKDSLLSGKMILAQTSAYQNKKKRIVVAQKFIEAASWNMLKNLQYYNRRGKDMEDLMDAIKKVCFSAICNNLCSRINGVRGYDKANLL